MFQREIFDCVYFMTVTATTVGYGDLSPKTWEGRLLSIFYMPFGTIVTMGGLLEPVGFCLDWLNKLNALMIARLQECSIACVAAVKRRTSARRTPRRKLCGSDFQRSSKESSQPGSPVRIYEVTTKRESRVIATTHRCGSPGGSVL